MHEWLDEEALSAGSRRHTLEAPPAHSPGPPRWTTPHKTKAIYSITSYTQGYI